jgi:hypothetical protein
MRVGISGCALVILYIVTGSAAAQGRKGSETSTASKYSGMDPFLAWATDWGDPKGEGVYTCEQWKQYATKVFNEADRNHDGYVDTQEFEAIRKAHAMFKDADVGYFDDNRDGRMSRGEFVDKPNPLFTRYDKKGTCRVTLDDIANASEKSSKGRMRR